MTAFKAFRRGSTSGKCTQRFKTLIQEPDMEWVSIDGSHVRAHQSSAGAANNESEEIAKSVGGNSSTIQLAVDAHGNLVDFLISDGVTHDIKVVPHLLSRLNLSKIKVLHANKGYDSEAFRDLISASQTYSHIPRKRNNKLGNAHMDWAVYEARHVVENTFARLKHFRTIATRFDKLKNGYSSTVASACAYIWLR